MSDTETEKFQIQRRLTKMSVPCDKLTNAIFHYAPEDFKEIILDHVECGCIEGEDHKGKTVVTPYWLGLAEDYVDLSPLTPFHKEVLFAAISAYEQGYRVLSYTIILNSLTGTVKSHIWKKQYEAIKEAVHKLMKTIIKVDLEPLLTAFPNYKKRYKGKSLLQSPLLPSRTLECKLNGQETFAIELCEESPLMTVAKLKHQIITYENSSLDIENQKNTENVIVLKNYLLRRIKLMKSPQRKKGLNNHIDITTIYQYLGIPLDNRWQKQDVKKIIKETLNHFKETEIIKDFKFIYLGGSEIRIPITL